MRRRTALLGGLVGLGTIAACGTESPTPEPSGTPTTPSIGPSTTMPGIPWHQLRSAVSGILALPRSGAYARARLTENPRFDGARPLAVLSVASVADVQAAVRFARSHNVPLAIRSGGHSYAGLSSGGNPPALVVDLRALNGVHVSGAQATLGSGISLAVAYAGLASAGRAIPGGSCATVGLGGLTLGGGVGVLTRAYGLTCDNVASVQMVDSSGEVLTASASENPDLFWALRGGGGRLGVVTSFTMNTFAAPTVNTFYRRWDASAASQVIPAWQAWISSADRRAWSTLKLLGGSKHPSGPSLLLSGTWVGPSGSNPLPQLLAHCPPALGQYDTAMTYGQAMASYAGCANIPVGRCNTGPGGALQREPLAATSHVASSMLSAAGVSAIASAVASTPSSLKESGISIDSLSGATNDLGADDTAWSHRGALFTVQYTATVYDSVAIGNAQTQVRHLRSTMTPWWGDAAYVNYIDPSLPSNAYFGSHLGRLRSIKASQDPTGLFGPSW